MKKIHRVLLLGSAVVATLALTVCKPIPYYLQMVSKVYGTVTDAKSGLPLESVEVSIRGYQYSELTNGLGDYELEVAVGSWTLDFSKEGYDTLPIKVTVEAQNTRMREDAALTPIPPALPDLAGTWIGENLPLGTVENPPLADLVMTLNPNGTFESLLLDTAYPKTVIILEYSTRGTYTYDEAFSYSHVTEMHDGTAWGACEMDVSYPYTLDPTGDELTMWQDLDWDGTPETPWTLIRQ